MESELLEALKAHLHVDGDAEDGRIAMLYQAAVQELMQAGVMDDGGELYRLMAFEKVRCWFDNAPQSEALQRLVNQGKLISTDTIF